MRRAIPQQAFASLYAAVNRRDCPLSAVQVAAQSGAPAAIIETLTDQLPHAVTASGVRYPELLPAVVLYCGSVSTVAESYARLAERKRLRDAGVPRELWPRKFAASPRTLVPRTKRERRPAELPNRYWMATTQAARTLGISAGELARALAWLPHSTVPSARGARQRVVLDTRDLALLGLLTDAEADHWATRRPGDTPAGRLGAPLTCNRRQAARVLRCRVPAVPAVAARYGVRPVVAGTGPLGRGELWRRDALEAAALAAQDANITTTTTANTTATGADP